MSSRPQGNGIVALHDEYQKERGFFCMELVCHLNNEAQMGTEEYRQLWHQRFGQAKAGQCHYREQCHIYERTQKKRLKNGIQLEFELF